MAQNTFTKNEIKELASILNPIKRNNMYADWTAIIEAENNNEDTSGLFFTVQDVLCTDLDNTTLIPDKSRERIADKLTAILNEKFNNNHDSGFYDGATFLSRQDIDDFLQVADELIKTNGLPSN